MKKNQIFVFAATTVLAIFCMSGQSVRIEPEEIAMAKCTRSTESCEPAKREASQERRSRKSGEKEVKSAARKVVEGKETSLNDINKSAAKRAMEAEISYRLER
jgi:hypothetical protein